MNVTISGSAPVVIASVAPDSICVGDVVQLNTAVSWNPPCDTSTVLSCASSSSTGTIGTGVLLAANYTPHYLSTFATTSNKRQLVFTVAELLGMGMPPGSMITAIAVNYDAGNIGDAVSGIVIKMGCTADPDFNSSANFKPGTKLVKTSVPATPVGGWNTYTFDYPYLWSGLDNLVLEYCTDVLNPTGNFSRAYYDVYGANMSCYWDNFVSPGGCGVVSGFANSGRANVQFTWCMTTPPGVSYQWQPAGDFSNQDDTLPNPTVEPSGNTVYTVTVSDPAVPACTGTDFVSVWAGDSFSIAPTASPSLICVGEGAQLDANPSQTLTYTYDWSPGAGMSDSTVQAPWVYPLDTTKYYVAVTAGGCTKYDSVTVFTKPSPPGGITVSAVDTSICNGETSQLNATPGYTYSWIPAASLNNATIADPVASPTTTTTYQVYVRDGATGCDTLLAQTILVGDTFPIDVTAVDTVLCSGSTQLSVTSDSSFIFTYSWTPAATLDDPTIFNPTATPTATTTYTVTVSRPLYGCPQTDSVTITLDNIPPFIVGSNTFDTSMYLTDSTFLVKLSEPVLCSTITFAGTDFELDCGTTTTPVSCGNNSIDEASGFGCVNDTTRWIYMRMDSPVPLGYQNDWAVRPIASAGVTDTCGNVISPTGIGGPTGSAIILPIELLYLTATLTEAGEALLLWETASEQNTDYFEVQRSQDGQAFESIGIVDAKGPYYKYSFKDFFPYKGINYYRLKVYDFDGNYSYTYMVNVNTTESGFKLLSVKPIPTIDKVNVVFNSNYDDFLRIEIFNLLGEVVIRKEIQARKGTMELDLDMEQLESGVYYLNMYYTNRSQSKLLRKLVKQ